MNINKVAISLGTVTLLFSSFSNITNAKPAETDGYKHLDVNVRIQQDPCWCGITAMQTWASWLKSKPKYESAYKQKRGQAYLANLYNTGSFNKNFYPNNSDKKWACAKNGYDVGGTNLSTMVQGLKEQSPSGYKFRNISYDNTNAIIGYTAKNIAYGKPVIILGNTQYRDGREKRVGGHYVLFDGVVTNNNSTITNLKSGSNITISSKVSGFYVNDPATKYSHIKSYGLRTFVSKRELKDHFLGRVGGKYQMIQNNQ